MMEKPAVVVPENLQPHVDELVSISQRHRAEPTGVAFDLVSSWCEVNPDESGFTSAEHGDSFMLVDLDSVASCCDDETIMEALTLDAGETITATHRATWIRRELIRLCDDPGDDLPSLIGEIRIAASDKELRAYVTRSAAAGIWETSKWAGLECIARLKRVAPSSALPVRLLRWRRRGP